MAGGFPKKLMAGTDKEAEETGTLISKSKEFDSYPSGRKWTEVAIQPKWWAPWIKNKYEDLMDSFRIKVPVSNLMVREESGIWSKELLLISGSGNDLTAFCLCRELHFTKSKSLGKKKLISPEWNSNGKGSKGSQRK